MHRRPAAGRAGARRREARLIFGAGRVGRAAANLLSYAGMVAFAALSGFLPAEATTVPRARVSEALLAATPLKTAVSERWHAEKKFPAPGEKGFAPIVERRFQARLDAQGRIAIRFTTREHKALDGKHLDLSPTPDPSAPDRLAWRCRSPDLEPRLLPRSCRDG